MSYKYRTVALMMDIALRVAQESRDKKKVGAVIFRGTSILSYGYNGTVSGTDNTMRDHNGKTKNTVIHAEQNAIAKLAKSTLSGEGAYMASTLLPCATCATSIAQSGIKRIYFVEYYKDTSAIEIFSQAGIEVTHIELKQIERKEKNF